MYTAVTEAHEELKKKKKRKFDVVFMMTSAEKRVRSSVFVLYFGENISEKIRQSFLCGP
jgi:hypothetical protein